MREVLRMLLGNQTIIWFNVSFTNSNCIYLVNFFSVWEIVVTVIYRFVGIYLFQKDVTSTTIGDIYEIFIAFVVAEK